MSNVNRNQVSFVNGWCGRRRSFLRHIANPDALLSTIRRHMKEVLEDCKLVDTLSTAVSNYKSTIGTLLSFSNDTFSSLDVNMGRLASEFGKSVVRTWCK